MVPHCAPLITSITDVAVLGQQEHIGGVILATLVISIFI